jgi:ATP-binding cassette subfamily B protein
MYEHNLYMSNLFDYLAITPVRKTKLASQKSHIQKGILFDKVGFQYPGQKGWALKNISLNIPKGQSLALVGHNGAGKSTLIKLLTKLYEPTEGDIFIDGKNLKDWSDEEIREHVSVVFQDFNKYQLTLGENVGLGSVKHMEDEERIKRSLQLSGGDELLPILGQGLKSPLGRWFMDGAELSGGQWQKIALARAFMREEADILILDEPTAALDAQAEHAVFEKFRSLTKGRTSILISHRFPTVRMADKIVVIEAGTIQEEGTHDSLVKANGRYAKLFALQAQGYL